MKKIIAVLFVLCFSSSAFALDPTGTGWHNGWCPTRYRDYNGNVIMKRCKKIDFNPIGMRMDMGVPDGLGVSLTGRPVKFFQVELGGTSTLTGGGIRGGGTLFLPWYVSPSITIEGGKQWAGNLNRLPGLFGGQDTHYSLLEDVQYSYANFHGGLSFGHPNWFLISLHAGYSYITGNTNGLQAFVRGEANDTSLTLKEANVKLWVPTAKLAIQLYF